MKYLLDTGVWLRAVNESQSIPSGALRLLNAPREMYGLAAISLWEVGKKVQSGKLPLPKDLPGWILAAYPGVILAAIVGSEEAHLAMLASVRRSNCTCGFPACSFHEDTHEKMRRRATASGPLYAPVGSIEAASVLGRRCTGFSKKELIHLIALTRLASLFFRPVFVRRLPRPTRSRRQSLGHAAFAALQVLFSGPTTDRASLATSLSLIGSLTPATSRRLRQSS